MSEVSNRLQKAITFLRQNGYAKSDAAIARRLGVTCSFLNMCKTGTREPSWGLLLDFCENYPIDFWWMRSGEGSMIKGDRELILLRRIEELENRLKELEEKQ